MAAKLGTVSDSLYCWIEAIGLGLLVEVMAE